MRILKTLGVVAAIWFVLAAVHEGFVVKSYIQSTLYPSGLTFYSVTGGTSRTVPATPVTIEKIDESKRPPEILPPKDHPPLHIVVGAHSWAIHYTTKEALSARHCQGFANNETREIWLPRKIKVAFIDVKADLLHEILHAVLYESRNGEAVVYEQDENSFVEPMAPQLLQVLQDNPTLVAWLTEKP